MGCRVDGVNHSCVERCFFNHSSVLSLIQTDATEIHVCAQKCLARLVPSQVFNFLLKL